MNEELQLQVGTLVTVTINDEFKEKCDENTIWVDYKNIVHVVPLGHKIFLDDGLIALIVTEKCESCLLFVLASNHIGRTFVEIFRVEVF